MIGLVDYEALAHYRMNLAALRLLLYKMQMVKTIQTELRIFSYAFVLGGYAKYRLFKSKGIENRISYFTLRGALLYFTTSVAF